jgi:hypothetical protein
MTSRPDELDPDVKSRAPEQIPVLDLEGDERRDFVRTVFARKNMALTDEVLTRVLERTEYYSARDFDNLVRKTIARGGDVLSVLARWQASRSISGNRRLQSLIAAQHCSYPNLLPKWLSDMSQDQIEAEIERLRYSLQH